MSRNAKIGIWVCIGLGVLCVLVVGVGGIVFSVAGGRLLEDRMVDDPERARKMAAEIMDYELPEGFHEQAGFDFYYGKMVMFSGMGGPNDDYRASILVAQILETDLQEVEEYKKQVGQITREDSLSWKPVRDDVMLVRGQKVIVTTYEGESGDGDELLRQLTTGLFEGKSGMVFICITGSAEDWPQEAIDAFLASIE